MSKPIYVEVGPVIIRIEVDRDAQGNVTSARWSFYREADFAELHPDHVAAVNAALCPEPPVAVQGKGGPGHA